MSKATPGRTNGCAGTFTPSLSPIAMCTCWRIPNLLPQHGLIFGRFLAWGAIETTPPLRFVREQSPDFLRKRFVGRKQNSAMTHERGVAPIEFEVGAINIGRD